jgi:hypothetical protein
MLKLTDLRKTTRRSNSGSWRTLHPHFLRDRSLAPRIDLAVRYFESMLGQPRNELDPEVVIQLFGDHKLARCIVACLAASYHHHSHTFAEVLPASQVAALRARGITNPSELRLWLFRRANADLPGFVGGIERPTFLRQAGSVLGLTAEQIESLLTLDHPERAVLARIGPKPTADDVITRFNYSTVAAILASAPIIRIALAMLPCDAQAIRELCEIAHVRAELTGRELILHGRQDALESWTRHGARLVHLLAALLACGLPAQTGEALVAGPHNDEWRFRLSSETFAYLGMPASEAGTVFSTTDLLECWRAQDTLVADYAAMRRAGSEDGWVLRRATEPVILAGAILPTLFIALQGTQRVPLVLAPRADADTGHLVRAAERLPMIALQVAMSAAHTSHRARAEVAKLPTLIYTARGDMSQLPALLAQVVHEAKQCNQAQQLEALFEEGHELGVLTEQQLAERLTCNIEDIPAVLTRPDTMTLAKDYNIEYIEGFGLCSVPVLMRARAAAREVAHLRDQADSAMQRLRVLGRRLREVTGASEGIECLIAYLGAA